MNVVNSELLHCGISWVENFCYIYYMNHTAELISAYSKDPVRKYILQDFDISMNQKNTVCWDELTVFLKIWTRTSDDWESIYIITDRSRDGHTEIQTTVAASMLAETIVGVDIQVVLTWTYIYIKELWLELSPRRRRSWVTALLATRNALHMYIWDGVVEGFENLL